MGYVDAHALCDVPTKSRYDDEWNQVDIRFFGFRFKIQSDSLASIDMEVDCYLYGIQAAVELQSVSRNCSTEISADRADELVDAIAEWVCENGHDIYKSKDDVAREIMRNAAK